MKQKTNKKINKMKQIQQVVKQENTQFWSTWKLNESEKWNNNSLQLMHCYNIAAISTEHFKYLRK